MFTPPEIIYRESAFYLDLDPYPTLDNSVYNQIVATSVLQFGSKGFFGSIDILKEESDNLIVK